MLPTFLSLRGVPAATLPLNMVHTHLCHNALGWTVRWKNIYFPRVPVVKYLGLSKMLKVSTRKPCLEDPQQACLEQNKGNEIWLPLGPFNDPFSQLLYQHASTAVSWADWDHIPKGKMHQDTRFQRDLRVTSGW